MYYTQKLHIFGDIKWTWSLRLQVCTICTSSCGSCAVSSGTVAARRNGLRRQESSALVRSCLPGDTRVCGNLHGQHCEQRRPDTEVDNLPRRCDGGGQPRGAGRPQPQRSTARRGPGSDRQRTAPTRHRQLSQLHRQACREAAESALATLSRCVRRSPGRSPLPKATLSPRRMSLGCPAICITPCPTSVRTTHAIRGFPTSDVRAPIAGHIATLLQQTWASHKKRSVLTRHCREAGSCSVIAKYVAPASSSSRNVSSSKLGSAIARMSVRCGRLELVVPMSGACGESAANGAC